MQPEDEKPSGQPGGSADPGNLAQPKSRLKPLLWTLVGFLATVVTACAVTLVILLGPAEIPGREVVVFIRPGMTMQTIAHELEDQGLIQNAQVFLLLAKLRSHLTSARAGEFLLNSGWPLQETLRVITTTNGVLHRVVVREGLPWWATAKLFEAENLADQQSFEQSMKNATLLSKYGVPFDTAEGFLFPETYQLPRTQSKGGAAAVESMLKEFERQAKTLWPQGLPPALELRRIVTLASLVERETGDASERPRIAGVFQNRLRLGMRLQCDPTTIYGLGPDFDGNLRRSHLTDETNPYNTYALAGLPPGPICSPGLESLKAAMAPEAHDFIYFVAKGDGTHAFSRTLDEHNRAVNFFQRHRDMSTYRSAPLPSNVLTPKVEAAPMPEPTQKAVAAPKAAPGQKAAPEKNDAPGQKAAPRKAAQSKATPAKVTPKSTPAKAQPAVSKGAPSKVEPSGKSGGKHS